MSDGTPAPLTPSHPLSTESRRSAALRATVGAIGRLAPGATARVAEALFVRTARPGPRPDEEVFLAAADRFSLTVAGETIAGYRWGDRADPAVLFAHGWWSHAGRFAPLAEAVLAGGFRGVAFDAPGHGRSTGWRASMPEFAATMRAIGTQEGPLHAVIGHSLGGAASIFAITRGLEVSRAVAIAAPADLPAWADRFRDAFGIPPAAFARMLANLERRLDVTWDDLHIPELAGQLTLPGLVVHDVHDPDIPWSEARAIADNWSDAELVTTEGLGHRAILRDPAVIERVVAFLKA